MQMALPDSLIRSPEAYIGERESETGASNTSFCGGEGTAHLSVIVAEVFGDCTLAVHQKRVPAPLLRQGCLVAFSHEPIQFALFGAHDLHILRQKPP